MKIIFALIVMLLMTSIAFTQDLNLEVELIADDICFEMVTVQGNARTLEAPEEAYFFDSGINLYQFAGIHRELSVLILSYRESNHFSMTDKSPGKIAYRDSNFRHGYPLRC